VCYGHRLCPARRIARCIEDEQSGKAKLALFGAALVPGASVCTGATSLAEHIRYTGSYSDNARAGVAGHRFAVSELLDPPAAPWRPGSRITESQPGRCTGFEGTLAACRAD
jgi:hypothetical protein